MEKVGDNSGREQSKKMKALPLWHSKDDFPYAFSDVSTTSSKYQPRKKIGISNFSGPNYDIRHLCSDLLRPLRLEASAKHGAFVQPRGSRALSHVAVDPLMIRNACFINGELNSSFSAYGKPISPKSQDLGLIGPYSLFDQKRIPTS
jgi:hypothetical protein